MKFENVPIAELTIFRQWAKKYNLKYRIRYRGPRRKSAYGRVSSQGQSTCLKRDALRFTAYPL
jgi:hypothetical protein